MELNALVREAVVRHVVEGMRGELVRELVGFWIHMRGAVSRPAVGQTIAFDAPTRSRP
jgi:hypothetical protein